MKKLLLVSIITLISVVLFAQTKPFPQHQVYTSGTIKPTNFTQAQMDQHIKTFYDHWKTSYLRTGCSGTPTRYYVLFASSANTANTSEGLGYGMMITALMAGYDVNAQAEFDGMYYYYKDHPSVINPSLMAWEQNSLCANVKGADAATDGDLDIAYSLLLADKQWGSSGTINYLASAKLIIAAILKDEVNVDVLKLGDWYVNSDSKYGQSTRPSDFMGDHCKAFQLATSDAKWNSVINRIYSVTSAIQTNYSTSGLLPDFVINATSAPQPAGANLLEGANDGNYSYNACRVPWRMGTDYLITGESRAKTACDKISSWLGTKMGANMDANKIMAGYKLDGTALVNYQETTFTGAFGVAAMCNSANQTMVNNIYSYLVNTTDNNYFADNLKLLYMLVMTGNYWPPSAAAGFTLSTSALNGTITANPVKSIYTSGDVVSLTATPASGYTFNGWSGDATGTANPLSVTMTSSKAITANFISQNGQWCSVQSNMFVDAEWKGYKDSRSTLDTNIYIIGDSITVPYKVAKMSKPNAWDTYISVDANLLMNAKLTGMSRLKITYKSDQPLILAIPQPSLAPTGESYMVSLPIAAAWSTLEFAITEFAQPTWSASLSINLALDSITGISISPDVDPTTAAKSGTIKIKTLLLCDVVPPSTGVNTNTGMGEKDFYIYPNPANTSLIVGSKLADNSNSTIQLMNSNGQIVYSTNNNISTNNAIDISNLSEGMYFIKCTSSNKVEMSKVFITH